MGLLGFCFDTDLFRLDLGDFDIFLEGTFLRDLEDAIGRYLYFLGAGAYCFAGGLSGDGLITTYDLGGCVGLYLLDDDDTAIDDEADGYGYDDD